VTPLEIDVPVIEQDWQVIEQAERHSADACTAYVVEKRR